MTERDLLPDQRYAPPQAHVEDMPPADGSPQLAGRGERLGAALIDGGIGMAVYWVASLALHWSPWTEATRGWEALVLNVLLAYVLFVAVHGYLLATHGQTLGKRALGLRITRRDGARPTLARLVGLRYGVGYLATLLPGLGALYWLGDSLMIFRASRRCMHDVIADTVVRKA